MKQLNCMVVPLFLAVTGILVLGGCGGSDNATEPENGSVKEMENAVSMVPEAEDEPADAYAPKLKVPDKLPDDPSAGLGAMLVKSARVPPASEVTVPLYPGAKILNTMLDAQGMLPSMILLSEDEVSEVLAFYREELAGWQYEEIVGIHSFVDGPEGASWADPSAPYSVVTLMAIEEGDTHRLMWPDVRTQIDMRWAPPEQ